jgi:hypothetical protein
VAVVGQTLRVDDLAGNVSDVLRRIKHGLQKVTGLHISDWKSGAQRIKLDSEPSSSGHYLLTTLGFLTNGSYRARVRPYSSYLGSVRLMWWLTNIHESLPRIDLATAQYAELRTHH